jgi:hypothetical protein
MAAQMETTSTQASAILASTTDAKGRIDGSLSRHRARLRGPLPLNAG